MRGMRLDNAVLEWPGAKPKPGSCSLLSSPYVKSNWVDADADLGSLQVSCSSFGSQRRRTANLMAAQDLGSGVQKSEVRKKNKVIGLSLP